VGCGWGGIRVLSARAGSPQPLHHGSSLRTRAPPTPPHPNPQPNMQGPLDRGGAPEGEGFPGPPHAGETRGRGLSLASFYRRLGAICASNHERPRGCDSMPGTSGARGVSVLYPEPTRRPVSCGARPPAETPSAAPHRAAPRVEPKAGDRLSRPGPRGPACGRLCPPRPRPPTPAVPLSLTNLPAAPHASHSAAAAPGGAARRARHLPRGRRPRGGLWLPAGAPRAARRPRPRAAGAPREARRRQPRGRARPGRAAAARPRRLAARRFRRARGAPRPPRLSSLNPQPRAARRTPTQRTRPTPRSRTEWWTRNSCCRRAAAWGRPARLPILGGRGGRGPRPVGLGARSLGPRGKAKVPSPARAVEPQSAALPCPPVPRAPKNRWSPLPSATSRRPSPSSRRGRRGAGARSPTPGIRSLV
jgi:hypothetical protein